MTIPVWVKGLLALLVITAIVAAIYTYGQQQFGLGEQAEKSRWLDRENKELVQANARIKTLEENYREQEYWHAEQLTAVSAKYQEEMKHGQVKKDRIIANLRGGTFRLRIPLARACKAGGSGPAEAASATGGRDGEARGELSPEAAEFLVGLASDCDDVTRQLAAAQAVIVKDRARP